jgi:hypothetical protein
MSVTASYTLHPGATLAPVAGAQAWHGPDAARDVDEWLLHLDNREIEELRGSLRYLPDDPDVLLALRSADVPLPVLAPRLAAIRRRVLHGAGFAVLRGMPVMDMTVREAARIFWGIGLHLGRATPQNARNQVLGHLRDTGRDYGNPEVRGYQTSARLPYHTDYADIVALLCFRPAESGGHSSLVSSASVYNEMLRRRPDLVTALAGSIPHTRWGEVAPGEPAWAEVPVFNPWQGTVVTSYVRSAIRKAQELPGVPALADAVTEGMDMLDSIAGDPAFRLDMTFEAGDIQMLNNHWVMHSRTAFRNGAGHDRQRHLLRLWAACPDGPSLPPAVTGGYRGATPEGRPAGFGFPDRPLRVALEDD